MSRVAGLVCVLLVSLAVACGGGGDCPEGFECKEVSAADYGADWPLNVTEGTLGCRPFDTVVFVSDDGTIYAVNNAAVMTDVYNDITPLLATTTGDPGVLRTEGLRLCSGG